LIMPFLFANDLQNWDDAIEKTQKETFRVETFAEGFDTPWGMAFLPNKDLIVSDRNGNLWRIKYKSKIKTKISGVPKVRYKGQGGLLDIEAHPDFINNNFLYISFSDYLESNKNKSFTSIYRYQLQNDNLIDKKIIFKTNNKFYSRSNIHYGIRMVFDKQGFIYFSIGDRGNRNQAQSLNYPNGKIHRLNDDGSIPMDNPFINVKNAIKSIWTYGNRNPQGLAIHPISEIIFESEHGPRGGDELNLIKKGINYGWPVITYGINYSGTKITDITEKEGMEQPIWYWTPSIALCGMVFYEGSKFNKWNNNLLVTSLKFERLHRLVLDGDRKVGEEIIFEAGDRVRDVEIGPKGFIYVALENPGRIVVLKPYD